MDKIISELKEVKEGDDKETIGIRKNIDFDTIRKVYIGVIDIALPAKEDTELKDIFISDKEFMGSVLNSLWGNSIKIFNDGKVSRIGRERCVFIKFEDAMKWMQDTEQRLINKIKEIVKENRKEKNKKFYSSYTEIEV